MGIRLNWGIWIWGIMGTRVDYAVGAFDSFHVGHLNSLRHARQHCDFLVAGVVSDEMPRTVKGDDWRGADKGLRLEQEPETVGVEVVCFPRTARTSSAALRRALDPMTRSAPAGAR